MFAYSLMGRSAASVLSRISSLSNSANAPNMVEKSHLWMTNQYMSEAVEVRENMKIY